MTKLSHDRECLSPSDVHATCPTYDTPVRCMKDHLHKNVGEALMCNSGMLGEDDPEA